MKVCLIYPTNFFRRAGDANPVNQHLFYLYSYLREMAPEVEVEILDLRAELSFPLTLDMPAFLREVERLLRRTGFDIAGISCWCTFNYPSSVEVARLCKRINPECQVVVGGWHPTFVPEDFSYPDSPFDYVVKGEGEIPLLDIVQGKIPRERPTTVVQGTPLPMDVHRLRWGEHPHHRTMKVMPIWLSRGCPFACVFCAERLSNYRLLGPRVALDELRRVLSIYPQVEYFMLYDPLFGIRKDWRREFLTQLKEADLPVHVWAETRVDLLEQEDIDLIAGLSFSLNMGLESVVPELLAIMKKTTDPQRYVQRAFELDAYMNKKHIPHVFNHIYNHPGETSRSLQQSLDFWQDYYRRVEQQQGGRCYTNVSSTTFMFLPGGEVYFNWDEYVAKYGCVVADPAWWRRREFLPEGSWHFTIGSRELAQAEHLDLPVRTAEQVTRLSLSHLETRSFPLPLLPNWEHAFAGLRAVQGMRYFEDKPLRLHPRAALYPREDGASLLYHYATRQSWVLGPAGARQLETLLAGGTVAALSRGMAPEEAEALARFVNELLTAEFLTLGYRPSEAGPAGPARVVLATSRGEIELALDAPAAPEAAASVLLLVERGFYDGLRFATDRPSTCVDLGIMSLKHPADAGPGYTLPLPAGSPPPARGAAALVARDNRLHGSRLRLYRQAPAEPEAAFVIGRVAAGQAVVDELLNGDYVAAARLAAAEAVAP